MLNSTGARLLVALATLPHRLLPQLVHVGRQVSLPPSVPPRGGVGSRRPAEQPPQRPHDPLVPSHVSGRLAAHRMVSYRLRIAGLYSS